MADSMMLSDEQMEDSVEVIRGEQDIIGKITQLGECAKFDNSGRLARIDIPPPRKKSEYEYLSERIVKLESQIRRILIHLNIPAEDEIVVTSKIPIVKE